MKVIKSQPIQPTAGLLKRNEDERSESESSGKSPAVGNSKIPSHPDPEVVERPIRRLFPKEYKIKILQEVDSFTKPGQMGELLRREGLYASHILVWKRMRTLGELEPQKKHETSSTAFREMEQKILLLERENLDLTHLLKQAHQVIDIQKKISSILENPMMMLKSAENVL